MKKTYVTKMPDKAGAFLLASQIISKYDGNIIRANYNKAVDLHTLFIEVSASAESHQKISEELSISTARVSVILKNMMQKLLHFQL